MSGRREATPPRGARGGPADLPAVRPNPRWTGYRCTVCGRHHDPDWEGFVCADCGIDGILDVTYDYARIAAELADGPLAPDHPFPDRWAPGAAPAGPASVGRRRRGEDPPPPRPDLWRFAPLLPVAPEAPHPAWSLGATPLHAPAGLRRELGLPRLLVKDDTCLPSASLKDRAAAIAIADAVRRGRRHLACASTGNAAASLAVLGARAGLATTIFVPADAPRGKLAQLLLHGARVTRVAGSYDQAFELSLRAMAAHGWYSRNCAHNPLLVEGKKTAALEVARDLGWRAPDAVFVGVGDGCIVSSIGKAFAELVEIGLCDAPPRIWGVQAEGAAPLAAAWARAADEGAPPTDGRAILTRVRPLAARTLADSIRVGVPRNRVKAWQRVAAAGGGFLSVSDERIVEAMGLLARGAGVFCEPSGAAGLAGCLEARRRGLVGAGDLVVVMATGHGLKDPGAALAAVEVPEPVPPDCDVAALA